MISYVCVPKEPSNLPEIAAADDGQICLLLPRSVSDRLGDFGHMQ
jgi:hypothetical protein